MARQNASAATADSAESASGQAHDSFCVANPRQHRETEAAEHLRTQQSGRDRNMEQPRPMNMKQLSAMIVLFVAVGTAMAVIISPFTGWDDLTRKSPDIIIARCATTPNPTGIGDGMISSDVEVLAVQNQKKRKLER